MDYAGHAVLITCLPRGGVLFRPLRILLKQFQVYTMGHKCSSCGCHDQEPKLQLSQHLDS